MHRRNLSRRKFLAASAALSVCGWPGASAQPERDDSGAVSQTAAKDPLPSWNGGTVKASITDFVTRVADKGSPDFVPRARRIATFDNDGTLWAEQPVYFQVEFALDRIRALAPQHPEWRDKQPFKAVLEGVRAAWAAAGEKVRPAPIHSRRCR